MKVPMNRATEIAMILGGLSICAVCFAGFSALSGVPVSDVPGHGALGPAQEEGADDVPMTEPPRAAKVRTESDIIESGLGSLGAWSLPAPYTARELRTLVDELKAKLLVLERREKELQKREQELDIEKDSLAERYESIEQMRTELERYKEELDLRERVIAVKEGDEAQRETAQWRRVAQVMAALQPEEAARKIVQYSAEDAAKVLTELDGEKAGSILVLIPDDRFREYLDAYSGESGVRK